MSAAKRERKWQETRENYVMRGFIIGLVKKYLQNYQSKEDERGGNVARIWW